MEGPPPSFKKNVDKFILGVSQLCKYVHHWYQRKGNENTYNSPFRAPLGEKSDFFFNKTEKVHGDVAGAGHGLDMEMRPGRKSAGNHCMPIFTTNLQSQPHAHLNPFDQLHTPPWFSNPHVQPLPRSMNKPMPSPITSPILSPMSSSIPSPQPHTQPYA